MRDVSYYLSFLVLRSWLARVEISMLPEGGWVLGFPDAGPSFRRVGKKDEALYLWLQIVFQPLNPPVSETFRSKS